MLDAYRKTDEVARNGAFQEGLRPEVFLGAPCICTNAEAALPPPFFLSQQQLISDVHSRLS